MNGKTARVALNTPVRFTSRSRCHIPASISSIFATLMRIAALLTRQCAPPSSSASFCTFALSDSASTSLLSGRLDSLLDNRTAYNLTVKLVRYSGESLVDERLFSYSPAAAPETGELAVVRRSFSSGNELESAFGVVTLYTWWK